MGRPRLISIRDEAKAANGMRAAHNLLRQLWRPGARPDHPITGHPLLKGLAAFFQARASIPAD